MTANHFWLDDWEHDCCGDFRAVGDFITVRLHLSKEGVVVASDDDDLVAPLPDGQMLLIGESRESVDTEPGWILRTSGVDIGYVGERTAPRACLRGEILESRHGSPDGGPPVGLVTGQIRSIRWRPNITETVGPREQKVVGYGDGVDVNDTNSYPGYRPPFDATELTEKLSTGAWRAQPVPYDPDEDFVLGELGTNGWAFEFVLDIAREDIAPQ
jgi:hypothetical protein